MVFRLESSYMTALSPERQMHFYWASGLKMGQTQEKVQRYHIHIVRAVTLAPC